MLLYIGKVFLGVRGRRLFGFPADFRGFTRRFSQKTFGRAENGRLGQITRQRGLLPPDATPVLCVNLRENL